MCARYKNSFSIFMRTTHVGSFYGKDIFNLVLELLRKEAIGSGVIAVIQKAMFF